MTGLPGRIIHQDHWNDQLVQIIDNGDLRTLLFGGKVVQSRMSLSQPTKLILRYTQYIMSALLIKPQPATLLVVGIGAGSMIRFLHQHFPHCRIEGVDYSSHIIGIARGYFRLPTCEQVVIHCCDGRDYIKSRPPGQRYDIIMLDAFDEQGMAEGIYSREFFGNCLAHLNTDGVFACNMWGGDPANLHKARSALTASFPSHITLGVADRGNVIGLAFPGAVPWERINRPKEELRLLSARYGLDFLELAAVAKKENLSLAQRLLSSFS